MNREMRKDLSQDKKMMAKDVHKHEKAMHPGKPLTPMKKGGRACMADGGRAGAPMAKMPMAAPVSPVKTLMGDNKRPPMPGKPMHSTGGIKYAKGGPVKKNMHPVAPSGSPIKTGPMEKMPKTRQVFAAGGVAKIRHNQATKAGKPTAGAQKKFGNLI